MSDDRIGTLLQEAQALGVARLDAHQLLAHRLKRTRAWLIAHDDEVIDPATAADCRALVRRRAAGEPFAYLVGEKEFHGLTLRVTPAVLIPRPDTETLVDWALDRLRGPLASVATPRVLDLGTGSGAIALAVRHAAPRAAVTALDASPDALAVARDNGRRLGLDLEWLVSDWWAATGDRRWHLALSNPPYIADDDPHLADLQHEPGRALTAGAEGLDDIERLIAGAPQHLEPGGWLLIEHGHEQADAVSERLLSAGFHSVETRRDLAGRPRCTGGVWNPDAGSCRTA